mgnify:FL=1
MPSAEWVGIGLSSLLSACSLWYARRTDRRSAAQEQREATKFELEAELWNVEIISLRFVHRGTLKLKEARVDMGELPEVSAVREMHGGWERSPLYPGQSLEFKVRMSRDVEVPDTVSILWTSQKGSSQGRSLVETAVWRDLLRQPEAKYGDPRNM